MAYVIPENRPYKRKLFSEGSIETLESKGYEWVFSSNVSAAKQDGKDLIIRFHNSSVYRYPNQGKNFERLMAAASKGKWVWRFLRRKNVPYQKIGSFPLPEDDDRPDEEIIRPRKRKYNVKSIVPSDEEIMKGVLPQISITPIEQALRITGGGGFSNLASLAIVSNDIGIIGALTAASIIKGT